MVVLSFTYVLKYNEDHLIKNISTKGLPKVDFIKNAQKFDRLRSDVVEVEAVSNDMKHCYIRLIYKHCTEFKFIIN